MAFYNYKIRMELLSTVKVSTLITAPIIHIYQSSGNLQMISESLKLKRVFAPSIFEAPLDSADSLPYCNVQINSMFRRESGLCFA